MVAAVAPVNGSAEASPTNQSDSSTFAKRFPAAAASSPNPIRLGFCLRPYPVIEHQIAPRPTSSSGHIPKFSNARGRELSIMISALRICFRRILFPSCLPKSSSVMFLPLFNLWKKGVLLIRPLSGLCVDSIFVTVASGYPHQNFQTQPYDLQAQGPR